MVNRSRAKGTAWESALVKLFHGSGFSHAHRLPLSSSEGDIGGMPVVVEAKNHKAMDLGTWMNQAVKSGEKTGKMPAVFHHRVRKGTTDGYMTMRIADGMKLLALAFPKTIEVDKNE